VASLVRQIITLVLIGEDELRRGREKRRRVSGVERREEKREKEGREKRRRRTAVGMGYSLRV